MSNACTNFGRDGVEYWAADHVGVGGKRQVPRRRGPERNGRPRRAGNIQAYTQHRKASLRAVGMPFHVRVWRQIGVHHDER